VVVRYNRRDPFRPQLVIAFDANGDRIPPASLGAPFYLGEGPDPGLKLASFAGEDLSYLTDVSATAKQHAEPDWNEITSPLETCYP